MKNMHDLLHVFCVIIAVMAGGAWHASFWHPGLLHSRADLDTICRLNAVL